MKIIGVMDEDPYDWRTWSGSSPYFFGALKQRGVLAAAVSAEVPGFTKRLYQAASFQPSMPAWRFRFSLNTGYYAAMTRYAARRIADLGCDHDTILQVGAWYDMTCVTDKPVCSYHDGNLAVLLRSPYGHPTISRRHIQRALDYERQLYARMRFVFPMSSWLADSFVKDNGVSPDRVHPVGAGINLPRIKDTEGRSYDAPRILFVGKDFARKGGPDLMQAFAMVRRHVPEVELTIIGPVLDNPPPGVRSLGPLSKSDPGQLDRLLHEYARASVFVMPSLYEPFGIVFAEAMAHRLPCIGTSICAMPEIIRDGETGYVVPPRDPERLSRRIVDLLRDPDRCRSFGEAGYRRYLSHYTWDAVTRSLCEVMQEA
jgi:glycosyltransferase involved in cell wall biosynthesis